LLGVDFLFEWCSTTHRKTLSSYSWIADPYGLLLKFS
jgi:hypothetical protein